MKCYVPENSRWCPFILPPTSVLSVRSKSLALHAVQSRSANPDCIQDGEADLNTEDFLIEPILCPESGPAVSSAQEEHQNSSSPEEGGQTDSMDPREGDRLWKHLRDSLEKIRAFCSDMVTQIPIPERCIIEGTRLHHSEHCFAKLVKC